MCRVGKAGTGCWHGSEGRQSVDGRVPGSKVLKRLREGWIRHWLAHLGPTTTAASRAWEPCNCGPGDTEVSKVKPTTGDSRSIPSWRTGDCSHRKGGLVTALL